MAPAASLGTDAPPWEHEILATAQGVSLPPKVASWMSLFGNTLVLVPLAALSGHILVTGGKPFAALFLWLSFAWMMVLTSTGWLLWDRSRPEEAADAAGAWNAFPSGHTAQALAFFGFAAYLWSRSSGSRVERFVAWGFAALVTAAVASGRLALATHWPSDVVAGAFIGGAWLTVLVLAHRAASEESREKR